MTEEDNDDFDIDNNFRFCEKESLIDKVRDHCHLTSNYRGPAHSICNMFVTHN